MDSTLNILMANWKWHRVGGDWTYIDHLRSLYEERGHRVIPFSMQDADNSRTDGYEQYFVDGIDYKELNKSKSLRGGITALSRTIYSSQARNNMERLLGEHRVDAAHLHNIHHYITPSILPVLKKHRIPVFWTLHDYTLICPENCFLSDGKICENCKGGRFYHCAIQRCKKHSFLASGLAALENYVHRYMHIFKHVDFFLCPSAFLYNKFLNFNFYPEKLVLTHLCFPFHAVPAKRQAGDYILFVGRLEKIKGGMTLLKAVEGLDIELRVAGTGAQLPELRAYIAARNIKNVVLLGHYTKEEIYNIHRKARLLVCPSEWYENFPFSIIESMYLKTPVIASDIGGIPELVVHERTGLLFEPSDVQQLRQRIVQLYHDKALQAMLSENAYARTASLVGMEKHYAVLKEVYGRAGLSL